MSRRIRFATHSLVLLAALLMHDPAGATPDYVVGWPWRIDPAGTAAPALGPLTLNPGAWQGFGTIFLEYSIVGPVPSNPPSLATRAMTPDYIVESYWNVTAGGAPVPPAPLVLDPATWGGFTPKLEYIIPENQPFAWTSITFAQIAGPASPNPFATVTIVPNQISNCGTSVVNAGCTPIPECVPGTYTIEATVQPGAMTATLTITIVAPWTSITFNQVAGPPGTENTFGPVTIVRGQISNCGTSVANAGCKAIPRNPVPGSYTINATMTFSNGCPPLVSTMTVAVNEGTIIVPDPEPNPGGSQLPSHINLVESTNGVPDPAGGFQVVVGNEAAQPIDGARVQIEFGNCEQMLLGSQQNLPDNVLDSCSPPIIHATCDATGTARFVVLGSAANRGAPEPMGPCAKIYASRPEGSLVFLGDVSVAACDQDGVNGLRANDVSLMLQDMLTGTTAQRSDYDGSGTVSSNDLSQLLGFYFDGGSQQTVERCDSGPTTSGPETLIGGLRLAWSECRGGGGTALRTSVCNTNTGTNTLMVSMVAPVDLSDVTGIEVTIDAYGDAGQPVPNWWHLEQGGCRPTAGSISLDFTAGPFGCTDPWSGTALSGFRWDSPAVVGSIDRFRVQTLGAVPRDGPTAFVHGVENDLLRLNLGNVKTVGGGACSGCDKPVAFELRSIRLTRPAGLGDKVIVAPPGDVSGIVYWQGVPSGFSTGVEEPTAPAALWLGTPAPTPSPGPFTIRFTLPRAARGALAIYDLAGRPVRELAGGTLSEGQHVVAWDGRTATGVQASSGVYFCRLRTDEGAINRTLVKLR